MVIDANWQLHDWVFGISSSLVVMKVGARKIPQKCNFLNSRSCLLLANGMQAKKGPENPLGSNVENGFGVIFLHANEIIMRALRAYQKQAFIHTCALR